MGGSNQGTAPPAASPQSAGGSGSSGIRCHESNGEVHFHDDAAGLKVAVPVATFHNMWNDLTSGKKSEAFYADDSQKTRVVLETVKGNKGEHDIRITVDQASGATYKILEKIASGKS